MRNVKKWMVGVGYALTVSLTACNDKDNFDADTIVESAFEQTTEDWTGEVALYKKGNVSLSFIAERDTLPSPLDKTKYGFKLEATNTEDSLFLFVKKKVSGLNPNRTYVVYYTVDLVTTYPDTLNSAGKLGTLKAGASAAEPKVILNETTQYYGVSIRKGSPLVEGSEMTILGNLSNTATTGGFKMISLNNSIKPVAVTPNAQGELWLCVGADTRFYGETSIYLDRIKATIR